MLCKHLLTLFLTLAVAVVSVTEASLRTYCLEDEDDCDEAWTPFPNMASALVGKRPILNKVHA